MYSVIEEMSTCHILNDLHSIHFRHIIGAVNVVLSLLAIVGNTLIIISILKSIELRNKSPMYFIISLATADLLVGAIVQPLVIIMLFDWSVRTCSIEPYKLGLGFFTCSVSICSAIMVCVDRMLMICKPYKYDTYITNKRALIGIVLIWILGAGIGSGSVMLPDKELMAFGTVIWVTTAIIIGVYCSLMIYKVGVRQIKDISHYTIGEKALEAKKCVLRERKLAASLFMVLAAILICWLPFVIVNICIQYMYTLQNWKRFYLIRTCAITFGYANSVVNIFIFSFKNREIKIAIRKILGIKKNKVLPEMFRKELQAAYGSTGLTAMTST